MGVGIRRRKTWRLDEYRVHILARDTNGERDTNRREEERHIGS